MKWYKAEFYWNKVEEVEVEKFTDSFVWIKGRRFAKGRHGYDGYFPSKEEAKAAIINYHEGNVSKALNTLNQYQENLSEAKRKLEGL